MIKCICDYCGKDVVEVIELTRYCPDCEEEDTVHFCSLICARNFLSDEIGKVARGWSEFERGLKDKAEEV